MIPLSRVLFSFGRSGRLSNLVGYELLLVAAPTLDEAALEVSSSAEPSRRAGREIAIEHVSSLRRRAGAARLLAADSVRPFGVDRRSFGRGQTTLIDLVVGLVRPQRGPHPADGVDLEESGCTPGAA
jgi:hypothetical protein